MSQSNLLTWVNTCVIVPEVRIVELLQKALISKLLNFMRKYFYKIIPDFTFTSTDTKHTFFNIMSINFHGKKIYFGYIQEGTHL